MKYILDFKNGTTDDQINYYIQLNNLTVIKTFNHFDKIYLVSSDVVPPKTDILDHIIEDHDHGISLLDNTDIINRDSSDIDITLSDEKNWWKVALFDKVNFDQDQQKLKRLGSRVTIYLLDSGVNLEHPDFAGTNVQNLYSFNNDFTDTKGHGTALASVIAGKECGISNALVKSVKIFDVNQSTLQSDMLSAFDAVLTDYMANSQKPSIINLSWSIPKNEYIEAKINYLISLGLIVICAAGNSGSVITNVTPASMFEVIKVGSFNQNFEPSDFSNYGGGSHISVTAGQTNYSENMKDMFGWTPGEMIYVANKDGGFGYTAGTSVSCAISSGVLAHNIDSCLTNDNNYLLHYNNVIRQIYFGFLFTRKNILNLSTQYSSCRNVIATMLFEPSPALLDENLNEYRLFCIYNQNFKQKICDEKLYNSIVYPDLSYISPNLHIDNGYIYGSIENNSNLGIQQFSFLITLKSNTEPDKTVTVTLNLANSLDEMKQNNISISSVDPTLTITLLNDSCCSWNGSACVQTGPSNCVSNCAAQCTVGNYGTGTYVIASGCDGGAISKATCTCLCFCWSGNLEEQIDLTVC